MKKLFFASIILGLIFASCENQENEFPDFDYSTVYFAYQSPVRTITLGEDIYDNSLDNDHKCLIMAAMGGVYKNKKDISLGVVVDNSLCESLRFGNSNGDQVIAMPAEYYTLSSDMKIMIPKGKFMGGIEVKLTDAFFADSRSVKNTFVIPLRIASVQNADSILRGKSNLPKPDSRITDDWATVPKDYILYAVKYINPWHGSYLRRGIDVVKGNSGNTTLENKIVYHNQYVEKDEVCKVVTKSMDEVTISLNAKTKENENLPYELVLKFDKDGKCVITNPESVAYNISGSGNFVLKGDMWGEEKRNVLHIKYNVDFGNATHSFTDTLVVRDRGVAMETFTPFVIK
ncbi:uncharacterized protein DUF1735 [Dysgonomonas alginatilytica]|uniref:Uncharacterized protein DUF1735 n=1 Tax=Dysgonomonas alginatilytica TaxID=1605892 RepID=A0A2V3PSH4_9BACT|nr:DUF5627 domain-containing protein [Dysgonomonas alginatilytica]PXV65836.1 uncharacterized protein DUF1735 [Dysgonomonas alginatilytica]